MAKRTKDPYRKRRIIFWVISFLVVLSMVLAAILPLFSPGQ